MKKLWLMGLLFCAGVVCAQTKTHKVTITNDKKPIFQLTTTGRTEVTPFGDKTVVQTPEMFLHIWIQKEGASVTGTIARVASVITNDVEEFKAKKQHQVKLGQLQGTLISGSGVEADDGDDGTAEVVVFKVGGRVVVACIHGERMGKAEHKAMLKTLSTARPVKPSL